MSLSLSRSMSLAIGGGGASSPLAKLRPILAPYKGAFWRFGDLSTVFESADTSDPAEIGDGVQFFRQSIAGTVIPVTWSQTTLANRPILQAGYAAYDGTDTMSGGANNLAVFQDVGAVCLGYSGLVTNLTVTGPRPLFYSVGGGGNIRAGIRLLTTGAIRAEYRRLDADATATTETSAGLVSDGVMHSILLTIDFANGGAGACKVYLDGTEVLSSTVSGTGNTSNTASLSAQLGSSVIPIIGQINAAVAAPFIPTTAERAVIFAALAA